MAPDGGQDDEAGQRQREEQADARLATGPFCLTGPSWRFPSGSHPGGVATAAPGLLPTVTDLSAVNRGDDYMTFTVMVKNTGDAATTAPVNVTLNLPSGMSMDDGTGFPWSCYLTPKRALTRNPSGRMKPRRR